MQSLCFRFLCALPPLTSLSLHHFVLFHDQLPQTHLEISFKIHLGKKSKRMFKTCSTTAKKMETLIHTFEVLQSKRMGRKI